MVALLVPVLGRAHQIQPLLESVQGNTLGEFRVVLILSPGDDETIKVARKVKRGTNTLLLIATWAPDRADYAKKLKLGFRNTDEEWLFQGATDLVFHRGWDQAALTVASRTHCQVIGTNDLGNPLVKRGIHSTHSLFSRSYIDEYGGTVDDSGLIFSEAYDHQWSDSEFIETARIRCQYAFAKRALVEHMHPHWGKAPMDDTYEKALRATSEDQKLFVRRRAIVVRAEQKRKRAARR